MEEKAEKPSEQNGTDQVAEKSGTVKICGARIWLSNKKSHIRSKKHNDANYVMSEKFEINKHTLIRQVPYQTKVNIKRGMVGGSASRV